MEDRPENGWDKEPTWHIEYGEKLKGDVFLKREAKKPEEVGTTKEGDKLVSTRESSKYTILKPDGKRFEVSSVSNKIQAESSKKIYSWNNIWAVQEVEPVEPGGTIFKQLATGDYAEAVYLMIEKCPEATQDEISRFILRIARAEKISIENSLKAAKEFGSKHGNSEVATDALLSSLSRRVDR